LFVDKAFKQLNIFVLFTTPNNFQTGRSLFFKFIDKSLPSGHSQHGICR